MPSPASFPNVNLRGSWLDSAGGAPGSGGFLAALKYWQDQLKQNAAGGLRQLAGAKASDAPAAAYAGQPYAGLAGPGTAAAIDAAGSLAAGQRTARNTSLDVGNQVQNKDLSGSLKASGEWGGSLTDYLQGQIALNRAQAQSGLQSLGGIEDIFNQLTQLGLLATAPATGGATLLPAAAMSAGGRGGPFSMMGSPGGFGGAADPFALLDPSLLAAYGA